MLVDFHGVVQKIKQLCKHHHHHHFRLLKADRTQLTQYMQQTPISNVNDNVNDNTQ